MEFLLPHVSGSIRRGAPAQGCKCAAKEMREAQFAARLAKNPRPCSVSMSCRKGSFVPKAKPGHCLANG